MSGLDVEALLDSTAQDASKKRDEVSRSGRDHRYRDRSRDEERRDRSKDRPRRGTDTNGDHVMSSPRSEDRGYRTSRRRSRSRDGDRRHSRHQRDSFDGNDDRGGRHRGDRRRSRSPHTNRDERSNGRPSYQEGGKDTHRRSDNHRRSPSPRRKSPTPQPTEDERDRRTVFVQQLAARLRTKELIQFFEKIGPVKEAQIVKDRVSGRSKGVGYVEFKKEESVAQAIKLTGQKLLGIPIIAQLTEAEKNRQARNPEAGHSNPHQAPFHRLYVGNIHFSITESDLQNVFEPFGDLEFVQLQKEEQGRSRGYGFVQFRDPTSAREALEKMNGFDLAGRPIRVGLGNDKFTPETTANLLQRFQGQDGARNFQGSTVFGHGGRGAQAGGAFDRIGARDNEKRGSGNASALDDTDVAGVNFNNYSRDSLMRKLARTEEPSTAESNGQESLRMSSKGKTEQAKPLPVNVSQASRCVLLRNMFDPSDEEGEDWIKELEEDVRAECTEKYGRVVHISLDPNTQGDIYLKFDRVTGGENAIKGLNGRFFGGRQISAQPVVDAVYSSLFSRTSAL